MSNFISLIDDNGNVVQGVNIPCPSIGSGSVTVATRVDGDNNTHGEFIGSVVGDDKLKIDISFAHLSSEQFHNFLKIFDRANDGSFYNTFRVFDPRQNDFVDMEMYVTDRSGRPLSIGENGKPIDWVDVSASLIQRKRRLFDAEYE